MSLSFEERDGGAPGEPGGSDAFAAAFRATRMPMILTDPHRPDNPIVFVNDAFLALTGYGRDEVVGRNCRFLQGPGTDRNAVERIHAAVAARRDIAVDLLNYRKDGSSFWNGLYVSPVLGDGGEPRYYFASQLDATDRVEAQRLLAGQQEWLEREVARRTDELEDALATQTMLIHEVDHRVKNNIQMISALLAMGSFAITDTEAKAALAAMLQRVEAIGTVHRRLYQSADVRQFDLADFVRDIAHELLKSSGRDDLALHLELRSVRLPSQQASSCALMLNELVTNALKHAFPAGRAGRLAIAVAPLALPSGEGIGITVADNGIGLPSGRLGKGFGTKLIRTLARQLQAEIRWEDAGPGTSVELRAPLRRVEDLPIEESRR